MKALTQWILIVLLNGTAAFAFAQDAPEKRQFKLEAHFYRVQTNITGNGLTSQTLPGVAGSFQILHEKWGDVEVVMEGETLTWNGESKIEHPNIKRLASPTITNIEGQPASMIIGDNTALQYFERKEDGSFTLKSLSVDESKPGIRVDLSAKHDEASNDVYIVDFHFKTTIVEKREEIEGVQLNVGKPVLFTAEARGRVGAREGEWMCYRTQVPSRGHVYLFMRITEKV